MWIRGDTAHLALNYNGGVNMKNVASRLGTTLRDDILTLCVLIKFH